ncbi:MAG: tRNA epoxyqueuosine(34) reductase QueG [Paenibacillaceae bacterium]
MNTAINNRSSTYWTTLKEDLITIAPSLGIDQIGFASADPFLALKDILLRHRELGRESGFEEPDINKRVYPELSLAAPQSIIAIAVAYPSKLVDPLKSEPGDYRGMISRSAWGEDYHHVLKDRLAKLQAYIESRVPNVRAEIMVDTGALSDRAVAERAGIGWVGKNCAVISPEWGSWIYLGEMITNIPFPPDIPVTEDCGDCTLCIDACPTGALVGPGQIHASSCISFVTQTKVFVEDKFKEKIGNRLYGCDTCQVVCPKNKGKNWTHHPELIPEAELVKPLLKPILTMSNKEYKDTFGAGASSWRGRKPIQRNAIIALGHFKDQTAIPVLSQLLLEDPRLEIRATSAWALGRIGGEEARHILEQARESEWHEQVILDVEKALTMI